jgi:acyl-CoA dehydrogenase
MLGFDLTEEQLELQATARRFARAEILPVAGRHDETEEFPLEICRRAFEAGLMNLQVPAEHGGLGLGVSTPASWKRS